MINKWIFGFPFLNIAMCTVTGVMWVPLECFHAPGQCSSSTQQFSSLAACGANEEWVSFFPIPRGVFLHTQTHLEFTKRFGKVWCS